MKTIQLYPTRNGVSLVDDEDYERLKNYKYTLHHGYAQRHLGNREYTYLSHDVLGVPPGDYKIDHKDRNKLNNQRYNLRFVSNSTNKQNAKLLCTNKSGFRGVSSSHGKWRARVVKDGRLLYSRHFNTAEEAARAYDKEVVKYFGSDAATNYGPNYRGEI